MTIEAISQDPVGSRRAGRLGGKGRRAVRLLSERADHGAVALLKHTPTPTDANIEASMGGNICRCGTYVRIRDAIKTAAQRLGKRRAHDAGHDHKRS